MVRPRRIYPTPRGPMTQPEAAEAFGLDVNTLRGRLHRGWGPINTYLYPAHPKLRRSKAAKTKDRNDSQM